MSGHEEAAEGRRRHYGAFYGLEELPDGDRPRLAVHGNCQAEALRVAVEHDLLDEADAEGLVEAWRFASRARNATVQVRGKPSDQLPRDARERAAVAAILQYEPGESDAMVNDYLRSASRARGIVDRVFWG